MLAGGIVGIVIYGLLVWWFPMIVLQITAFVGIAAVLAIVAWIGYTLATTPPPKPIEEIEKELEQELKKLEEEPGKGEKEEGGGQQVQPKT